MPAGPNSSWLLWPRPAWRPRWSDGRERGRVAERVTSYLAGVQERLRSAELARVEAQARAEEETKRRVASDELAPEAQARADEAQAAAPDRAVPTAAYDGAARHRCWAWSSWAVADGPFWFGNDWSGQPEWRSPCGRSKSSARSPAGRRRLGAVDQRPAMRRRRSRRLLRASLTKPADGRVTALVGM